jgi:hypothetical protein
MKRTKNLRLEMDPYPHLRDDEGCILARDYVNHRKIEFILHHVKAAEDEEANT